MVAIEQLPRLAVEEQKIELVSKLFLLHELVPANLLPGGGTDVIDLLEAGSVPSAEMHRSGDNDVRGELASEMLPELGVRNEVVEPGAEEPRPDRRISKSASYLSMLNTTDRKPSTNTLIHLSQYLSKIATDSDHPQAECLSDPNHAVRFCAG